MTEYYEPRELDEACELVRRHSEDGKILAGGTALVLFMRQRLLTPDPLINIQKVSGLSGIDVAAQRSALNTQHSIQIGALTTHTQAARSHLLREHYPALGQTFAKVATPRIRNAGTVGGNLAHGDPHLDPPVTLLALDAWVTAKSTRGQRHIPLKEFFRDYYETALAPDEILTHVTLPARVSRSGLSFIKFLPRSQDDYATVDVAVWLQLAEDSAASSQRSAASVRFEQPALIEDVRIALGSVGPVPFRALEAEAALRGQRPDDGALTEAGSLAASACDPEDDVRGSAAYKRELVKVLVRRAVGQALGDASGTSG